jgi:prolyl-tRNA synthetase
MPHAGKEPNRLKLSQAYLPTQKEIPSDAVIPSHRLMIRAGLIRPLAAGIYTILPMGWKVMLKVMAVVREEMNKIGAQELHMPALNPVEIWDETGRNADFGNEIFRLKDRKDRPLLLAPTHEEIICDLARKYVRSYKDLPQIWYQIQNKFRDEPRPRSGVIRTRQFFMKDSYSLDADEKGLEESYRLHERAYRAIFSRCGLKFHVVGASSGLMGGKVSQEFMLESDSGEDTLVLCDACGYAANQDVAASTAVPVAAETAVLREAETPDRRTIEEVSDFLGLPKERFAKALFYVAGGERVLVLLRGDHDLNENKLQSVMGAPVRPAHPEEIKDTFGIEAGFIGPVRIPKPVRILADEALRGQHGLVTGANREHFHLTGVEFDRDFRVETFVDARLVLAGEACRTCGKPLRVAHAIELGHIFKLGTKYSAAMKAEFLDPSGKAKPIIMGSYGIGIERIIAAAIEQGHDEAGIVWNSAIAPYAVHLIPIKMDQESVRSAADQLYGRIREAGFECLYDDRSVSPGVKFKDADLLGIPVRLVLGKTWTDQGLIEFKLRKAGSPAETVSEDGLIDRLRLALETPTSRG